MSSENLNAIVESMENRHAELQTAIREMTQHIQVLVETGANLRQQNEKLLADNLDLGKTIAQFLFATSWFNYRDCDTVQIVTKGPKPLIIHCGTMNFRSLESKLTKTFPNWKTWDENYADKDNNKDNEHA